jgi:hypothetical protein
VSERVPQSGRVGLDPVNPVLHDARPIGGETVFDEERGEGRCVD